MKINLIFFLARFGKGGAGNSVYRLCEGLNKKKFNITVICLNKCAYEKKLRERKIRVIKIFSSRALFSIISLKEHLKKITSNYKKNILISNINYTNLLCAIFIKKKKNLKLIAFERTPFQELEIYFGIIDKIKKFIMRLLIGFFYKKFDLIICNSKFICKHLKKKYKISSLAIFPPAIKTIIKNKKNYKNNINTRIITVCRLSKEKNLYEMINSIEEINDKKLSLKIVGDGPERKNLGNYIKNLKTQNKIKLIGHKDNPYKFLKNSDLYLNSSSFEGFPNSVVEAVNAGVPVIASQSYGGINDILLNGKGGEIYIGNYITLRDKIVHFINNKNIFLKKIKTAHKNLKRFTVTNHVNKFEKEINKIYKL